MIASVLALFLAVTVIDFVPGFVTGFKTGFEAGQADSHGMMFGGSRHLIATVAPQNPDTEAIIIYDGIEVRPLETVGDVVVPAHSASRPLIEDIAKVLLAFVFMAAMLSFVVHLVIFAVMFPRRRIMAHKNIVSMRWIAGSLGTMGLSIYLITLLDYLWLTCNVHFEKAGYEIVLSSPPSALIVALILVVMTEILNMAGKLQHEQELTI